jgi:hypothetical protein
MAAILAISVRLLSPLRQISVQPTKYDLPLRHSRGMNRPSRLLQNSLVVFFAQSMTMIEFEHSLPALIPVLVTGIQRTQVLDCKRLFCAADAALLDYLHEAGNEGG